MVNLTGVHQVAGVPCANIDLKESVKKERVGHEDPSEMEQGLNAVNIVRGRVFLICVLCLSCLESHSYPRLCCAFDFHNEDDGSYFMALQRCLGFFFFTFGLESSCEQCPIYLSAF